MGFTQVAEDAAREAISGYRLAWSPSLGPAALEQ
jgi:hypothetical protein